MEPLNPSQLSESDASWPQQGVLIEKFKEKPSDLEVYQFQVSGKTSKYINNVKGTIYKQYSESQYKFYEFLSTIPENDDRSLIKQFIPKYHGMKIQQSLKQLQEKNEKKQSNNKQQKPNTKRNVWIEHISSRKRIQRDDLNKFIVLQNMTFGYIIPNIIDLKLGTKKSKKSNVKFQKSATNSHKFRINGMMVGIKQEEIYQQIFISKYHGQKITVDETETYLSLFFFNGKQINLSLLQNVIEQLRNLIKAFQRFHGIKFISSSLFIAYDAENPSKFTVNLIDFDKYEHNNEIRQDENISEGLINIEKFLSSALTNYEKHQQILRKKELSIFNAESIVIPQDTIDKYNQ